MLGPDYTGAPFSHIALVFRRLVPWMVSQSLYYIFSRISTWYLGRGAFGLCLFVCLLGSRLVLLGLPRFTALD